MDSSVSGKDEIWFLRVCHHVRHELYIKFLAGFKRLVLQRTVLIAGYQWTVTGLEMVKVTRKLSAITNQPTNQPTHPTSANWIFPIWPKTMNVLRHCSVLGSIEGKPMCDVPDKVVLRQCYPCTSVSPVSKIPPQLHTYPSMDTLLLSSVRCISLFWHSEDRASWYILILKPTRCTNFPKLFLEYNSACFGQVFCPSSGV